MKPKWWFCLVIIAALTAALTVIPSLAQGRAGEGAFGMPSTLEEEAEYQVFFPLVMSGHTPPQRIVLLHTNDFHGNLQPDSSGRGGSAYIAGEINRIRDEAGPENVALVDAGDSYLGAKPISQLLLGESTIDIYNMIGYQLSTYGNHEFDKGQELLITRTLQSDFPWISANIVISGTDWEHPWWSPPYEILNVGSGHNRVRLGVIGLSTDETPLITLRGTTDGLEFKDPTAAVLRYYDEVLDQSDALIVLAHIGSQDSGAYKGLRTIAQELIDAGKPVPLMIGGHQHEALHQPIMVGETAIVAAGHSGRWLGRADLAISRQDKTLSLERFGLITITNQLVPDLLVADRVAYWAAIVEPVTAELVGTTNVSLIRNYNAESNMGNLVTDSMLWKADMYDDGEENGSVHIAFTNPGGLRDDILIPDGVTLPYTVTWGYTFNVLPFGNTLFLMDLTGAQVEELMLQSAKLFKGILQTAGATYEWYNDCMCATPTAWDVRNILVAGEPLDPSAVYRVVTNDFLAGGQDGWVTFADGVDRWNTYFDMQEGLNDFIVWYNDTVGPLDHAVEGRIVPYAP